MNANLKGTVGSSHMVHLVAATKYGNSTACGAGRNEINSRRRRSSIRLVADETEITCKKCLKKMQERQAAIA